MTRPTQRYTLKRGEVFNDFVECNYYNADGTVNPTFDFTGLTLEIDLREGSKKEVVSLTTSVSENVPGKIVFSISLTPAQTAVLPLQVLKGDTKFSRTSPAFTVHA